MSAGRDHRFEPGEVVATPGAIEMLRRYGRTPAEYLGRNLSGDWGDLDAFDVRENEWAIGTGARLFSSDKVSSPDTLWIVTETERSSTYLLLPEEY